MAAVYEALSVWIRLEVLGSTCSEIADDHDCLLLVMKPRYGASAGFEWRQWQLTTQTTDLYLRSNSGSAALGGSETKG